MYKTFCKVANSDIFFYYSFRVYLPLKKRCYNVTYKFNYKICSFKKFTRNVIIDFKFKALTVEKDFL